jgi:hypothetical protein
MARSGESVAAMFNELKRRLGPRGSMVDIVSCMREAFHLSLAEAKPLAALSRTEARDIQDPELLDRLLKPAISKHRHEWDVVES